MHVKAELADDHTALVTSANLTGAALLRNMELGLLVKRGPLPVALAAHVDALIDKGELQRVSSERLQGADGGDSRCLA
ncbi:MAG: phospholipase D-like domain-containing protein [Actinomycetota bacterium]|nr:phospholipase D-like domain-containing protein [Actinomycetota bacterium]